MKYLSDYTNQAQSELFDKTGAFFAFSQKQFDESAKKDTKYASLGHGLICPVSKVDQLKKGIESISKNAIRQDVSENGAAAIISREYFNYESQITMETDSAKAALSGHIAAFPDLFTNELIKQTFKQCFQKAIENDWF